MSSFLKNTKKNPCFKKNVKFLEKNLAHLREVPKAPQGIKAKLAQFLGKTIPKETLINLFPSSSKNKDQHFIEAAVSLLNTSSTEVRRFSLSQFVSPDSEDEIIQFLKDCQKFNITLRMIDFTGIKLSQAIIEALPLRYLHDLVLGNCSVLELGQSMLLKRLIDSAKNNSSGVQKILKQITHKIIEKFENPKEKIEVSLKIAEAQVKIKDIKGAKATIVLALAEAEKIMGVEEKAITYGTIAKTQVKIEDIKGAKATIAQVFVEAEKITCPKRKAGIIFYTIIPPLLKLVEAQAKIGDAKGLWETVTKVLTTAKKGSHLAFGPDPKDWPDRTMGMSIFEKLVTVAFPLLAEAQIKDATKVKNTIKQAFTEAKKMKKKYSSHNPISIDITTNIFPILLEAQIKNKDISGLNKTLDRMFKKVKKFSINPIEEIFSLKKIGEALIKRRLAEVAKKTLTQAVVEAKTYIDLVRNNPSNMPFYYHSTCDDFIRRLVFIFPVLVTVQVKSGDVEGAKETIAQALAEAEKITNPKDKARVYGDIAEVQAKVGDLEGAKETFAQALAEAEKITNPKDKARVYEDIAEVQAKVGDLEGAKETFVRSLILVEKITKEEARTWASPLVSLLRAKEQVKSGDVKGAKATLSKARAEATKITNEEMKEVLLEKISKVEASV